MKTSDGLPDEAILRAVLAGDVEAYGLLVERHSARLLGLAFHLCGDYDTAMDLAQETLVAAYNCLDRIKNPAAFGGWLAAILRNKFRNLARRNRTPTVSLEQMMAEGFDPPAANTAQEVSDQELAEVMKWVQSLPEKHREVLMLRYVDDLSYKDIAKFLSLPVTTVTTRLTYARRALIKKAKEGGLL